MGNKLALAALVLALAALLLHAFGDSRERSAPQTHPLAGPRTDAATTTADWLALLARIEALEAQQDELRQALGAASLELPPPVTEREPSGPDPRVEELARRLASLEQGLTSSGSKRKELEKALEHGATLRLRGATDELEQGSLQRLLADIDEAQRRARDLSATEAERLAALRMLEGNHLADGTDARLAVLDDMIELARVSTSGEARADVWRQLSGVRDPRLLRPLLDALAFDQHPKAREEAAETLADFLPDAAIEAALRAALNDADPGVRRQAGESLARR